MAKKSSTTTDESTATPNENVSENVSVTEATPEAVATTTDASATGTDTSTTATTATTPASPKKPGRQPGSVARPPFPWDASREEALINAVYANSTGNECSLDANALFDLLKGQEAFTSSPVAFELGHVKARVKKLQERMAKAGDTFPALKPSARARVKGLSPEDIQRLRSLIAGGDVVAQGDVTAA